jgi:hypothetical protein
LCFGSSSGINQANYGKKNANIIADGKSEDEL